MSATVVYDGECGLCTGIRLATEPLDWFSAMRWIPFQAPEAGEFGIPREEFEKSVYFIGEHGSKHGFPAVKAILARVPATWIAAAALVAWRPWTALAIAAFFSPLSNPIGQPLYDWVAANRHLIPGPACGVGVECDS
jgi:predicted DCC family thiol-disulfide oxidoreductase YuxK